MARATTGNTEKHERYAAAFERIQKARDQGFHIEAIMICESIITDRLGSHFQRRHAAGQPVPGRKTQRMLDEVSDGGEGRHVSMRQWLEALEDVFDDYGEPRFLDLLSRLHSWHDERNDAAHAFVKSHAYSKTYTEPLDTFLGKLDACAQEGVELARAVDAWTRRTAST